MGMMETINKFVDTMLEEQQGFETMQNEVSKKEEDVLQELKNLEQKEKEGITLLCFFLAFNPPLTLAMLLSS